MSAVQGSVQEYDVIIAGGGPAGCVLASRLSEDASKRVLLTEAGPDFAPGAEPADILDPFALSALGNAAYLWSNLFAEVGVDAQDGKPRAVQPYLQARCVGGASNINGMAADRGQPGDYDRWTQSGASGWGWQDVLPYFRKLEHDLDHPTVARPMHGTDGPMPLRRLPRSQWAPFCAAVGNALERRGFRWLDDYNADFSEGFGSVPMNCLPDRRVSTSMAYLTAEVRRRPNLTILPNCKVVRLSLEGSRVTGVFVARNGREELISARQVIASCGALQTPALLMRSGIGPAEHLRSFGISPIRDLAGVGANLHNHPILTLTTYLPPHAGQPAATAEFLQGWLRFSSKHANCVENDMHLMAYSKCAWHALGSRVGAISVSVLNSYSRGSVRLSGAEHPRVAFNFLDDRRDFDRLVQGLRLALELLVDPGVERVRHEIFIPNDRLVASLTPRSAWNRLRAAVITRVLDASVLRRRLFAGAQIDPQALLGSTELMEQFVTRFAAMQFHACGTCRMGAAEDPQAVVDGGGKVHGLNGLRVADASILPSAPRGYTHFIVIMAAEKIADAVRSDWSH